MAVLLYRIVKSSACGPSEATACQPNADLAKATVGNLRQSRREGWSEAREARRRARTRGGPTRSDQSGRVAGVSHRLSTTICRL